MKEYFLVPLKIKFDPSNIDPHIHIPIVGLFNYARFDYGILVLCLLLWYNFWSVFSVLYMCGLGSEQSVVITILVMIGIFIVSHLIELERKMKPKTE